jgi:hypothetical protein
VLTDVQRDVPEAGLADVVTLQDRASARSDSGDEVAFFQDTIAEYCWARDVAGLAPLTLQRLMLPVLEVCGHYDCVPWRLSPRQPDLYFAEPGKRKHSTMRKKITQIDGYYGVSGAALSRGDRPAVRCDGGDPGRCVQPAASSWGLHGPDSTVAARHG